MQQYYAIPNGVGGRPRLYSGFACAYYKSRQNDEQVLAILLDSVLFSLSKQTAPGDPVALRCQLENPPGDLDLYLVFHGTGEELIRLEWFKFWS